jgi:hypothetical protein
VQYRPDTGKNVETHLNNLLVLNAIKRDCLFLPNLFRNDPVQHSKDKIEVEVPAVSVLDGKDLLLTVFEADRVKLLLVELSFFAQKFHLVIVVVLPLLFEFPVLLDQAIQSLVHAEQFGLNEHVPVAFFVQFEVVHGNETIYFQALVFN